jgi:glycosyltransferase involved in cell wall biosynthesis
MNTINIAIVVSHPIQHFCPMYASWARNKDIKLKVFFASNIGLFAYQDPHFSKEIKWENLYLEDFDHIFLNGYNSFPVDKHLDAPNLEQELNKFKPDLVIQYGRIYKFNRRLRKWLRNNNVISGYISDSENRNKEFRYKRFVKKFIMSSYFKKIDLFLSVGDANEDYYISNGVPKENILRMNFSIDIKNFDKHFAIKEFYRSEFRNSFEISQSDIVLSVVGKLVEWKSQIHLIKALQIIEKSNPELKFHLLIAGSGPTENLLKIEASRLKNNTAHFLGFVDPIQLPKVYAASDIYIHPSLFEPHSLAVSEAIYMGLPVIISSTSGSYGPMDDVRIGLNGEKYSFGEIQSLVNYILKLSQSEKLRKMYQQNSIDISRHQQELCHTLVLKSICSHKFFNN